MSKLLELFILPVLAGLVLLILGKTWSAKKKAGWTIAVFVIALGLCYGLSEQRSWVLSGQVIDGQTLKGIGQARILDLGSVKEFETEDNGNFRLDVYPSLFGPKRVRIRVTKQGYHPADRSFEPPIENIIIEMEKTP